MSLDAEARVGGGGGFGGGGGSSSSGSGSSDGLGILFELLILFHGGCVGTILRWVFHSTSAIVFAGFTGILRGATETKETIQCGWHDAGSTVCFHQCTHGCGSTLLRTIVL